MLFGGLVFVGVNGSRECNKYYFSSYTTKIVIILQSRVLIADRNNLPNIL